MTRHIPFLILLLLLAPAPAQGQGQGQDRLQRLPSGCLVPTGDLEMLKARLLAAAQRGSRAGVSGLVHRSVAPGPPPGCPTLSEDHDLDEALETIIHFAAQHESGDLQLGVVRGVLEVVTPDPSTDRETRAIPLDALTAAVEGGRTEFGRAFALWTLLQLVEDSGVRQYLVQQVRAARGPPAWPELPKEIVRLVYVSMFDPVSVEENAALRDELERDPSLIQNPVVRCLLENRHRPRHGAPDSPTAETYCRR